MQFGKDVRCERYVLHCLSTTYGLSGILANAPWALPEVEVWQLESITGGGI